MPSNKAAYVQQQSGDWLNEDCYIAAKGLTRMGFDVFPFEKENVWNFGVKSKQYFQESIIVGGINTMRDVFDTIQVKQPEIHNVHTHLPSVAGRLMGETILSKIKDGSYSFPIFIKPLEEHKLFTGFVVKHINDLLKIFSVPDDTKVLYSEVINFISEYRCFISRGKLVGCKNYTGDFKVLPNFNEVDRAILTYKDSPISYTLDFGITDSGRTILIEINDGFGLGSYGLNPIIYCKMLLDRWKEIVSGK